jgi:hypothetical protein
MVWHNLADLLLFFVARYQQLVADDIQSTPCICLINSVLLGGALNQAAGVKKDACNQH